MKESASGSLCVACKGRLWCKVKSCPLLDKVLIQKPAELKLKKEVFGPSPPNVFCGWMGYPNVSFGPMVAYDDENTYLEDDPAQFYGWNFNKIIQMRSSLVRGKRKEGVFSRSREVLGLQDAVMSQKPVDMEVGFDKTPRFTMSFSPVSQPMGPSAGMRRLRLVGNVAIPGKVDSVVEEGLKVKEALPELLKSKYDYYYLQKLLCAGLLGQKNAKKLVPTRWSITATDSLMADFYVKELKELPEISEICLYSNEYLFNHFEILVLPGKWEFEQFESWAPNTIWTQGQVKPFIAHEYEPFEGRSDYAETEGGGYYAGKMAVAEGLATRIRRQGRVIVFREIYDGYKCPVGVWEIRQTVRHAFDSRCEKFSTLKDALGVLSTRLKHPTSTYYQKSRIMSQRKLADY